MQAGGLGVVLPSGDTAVVRVRVRVRVRRHCCRCCWLRHDELRVTRKGSCKSRRRRLTSNHAKRKVVPDCNGSPRACHRLRERPVKVNIYPVGLATVPGTQHHFVLFFITAHKGDLTGERVGRMGHNTCGMRLRKSTGHRPASPLLAPLPLESRPRGERARASMTTNGNMMMSHSAVKMQE